MTGFEKKHSQIVKGAAVCLLLWHHLFGTEQDIVGNGVQLRFLSVHQLANSGAASRICVYLFAFISAYGWTVLYGKQKHHAELRSFYKTRWLRLMTPFWSCYAMSFILSLFIFTYAIRRYAPNPVLYAALDFMGIGDLFGTPMLAGIWWYMCFAQLELLFLPLLIKGADFLGWALFPAVYILVRFAGEGIVSRYGGAYYQYTAVVVLGVLMARLQGFEALDGRLAKITAAVRKPRLASGIFSVLCLAAALLVLYLTHKFIAPADAWRIFGVLIAFAALLIICFFRFLPLHPRLERPLLFFGKHSGNIFLLHGFLLVRFQHALYATGNPLLCWCTLMGGSLVLSFLLEAFRTAGRSLWKTINCKRRLP